MREHDGDWDARVQKWVEEGCAAQGIPVKFSDPVTIRYIAAILRGEAPERRRY